MFDDELEKIRLRKAEMLRRLQLLPKEIVKIHSIEYFNKILKDFPDKILIIDFWAVWCAPCKAFAPVFEQLQQEYFQDFIFAKVNVDENQALAQHYKITGIPTTLFLKSGKVINKIVGSTSYNNMKTILEKLKSHYY